jgi:hypothetical protein
MSEDENRQHREIEPSPPEVISPRRPGPPSSLGDQFGQLLENAIQRMPMMSQPNLDVDYADLGPEEKKIVDEFIDTIDSEINLKAVELIKAELRDKIARRGDVARISKLLRKGKKPYLKRKKGCIFVQFGTGEPNDEMEEFLLMST